MALVEVSLSVTCRTQSATCAVTEVNESQKLCENAALNLEDCCCAVNLRACTSAQNYLRADVSMETAHCVLRGLISRVIRQTEVTKVLTAVLSAVSSVMRGGLPAFLAGINGACDCAELWWWWSWVCMFSVGVGPPCLKADFLSWLLAEPADRKSLAHILESQPKSLLLLLL